MRDQQDDQPRQAQPEDKTESKKREKSKQPTDTLNDENPLICRGTD